VILDAALDKHTRGVFIDGFWGTSKTYLAVLASLRLLNAGRVSDIIFVRNPLEASTTGKVGLLPGSVDEKMAPYNAIFYDKLEEFLPRPDIDRLKKENRVSCMPLSFCRGLSWNCKAIIVDEAACMTWEDLILLMSRCGEFTRIFFLGDSQNQNEIGSKSGFARICQVFNDLESKENGVYTFELREQSDIVRSSFLQFVMRKVGILPTFRLS
jgi:phosphate starvation-inducible PhoH-like protein